MADTLEQNQLIDFPEENIFILSQQFVLDAKVSVNKEKEYLFPEDYKPPFNVCEILVETELNLVLSRFLDICRCNQCRVDIISLALRELPARYITDTRDEEIIKKIAAEYMERTMLAVHKAVKQVFKNPRKSCKKIMTVLWKTQENLEWVH